MLDRKFIITHIDDIARNCEVRNVKVDIDQFVELDAQLRDLTVRLEQVRRSANLNSKQIAKTPEADRSEMIKTGAELKREVSRLKDQHKEVEEKLRQIHLTVPNLTHPSSPIGDSDAANQLIDHSKTPVVALGFKPKDHVELGVDLGIIDFEAGSRVAGHGFYFLIGDGVLLDLALQRYAIQIITDAGYQVYATPDIARSELLTATGYSPRVKETDIYSIEGTNLGLIATSEITLAGLYEDSIIDEDDLPIRIGGLSHCFRTEAGSHGRATRGFYRVHQFTKVEMFAFTLPEDSAEIHQEILAIQRRILDGLEIPYQVVENATGDLGASAYRKFDIEAWMPGRGEYGEVTSASNCTDYQARRLRTRYRSSETGKSAGLVHTLNGTACAMSRVPIAVMENYQNEDGSITVPEVLRPLMQKERIDRN